MPYRQKKYEREKAARARAGRLQRSRTPQDPEACDWDGSINHMPPEAYSDPAMPDLEAIDSDSEWETEWDATSSASLSDSESEPDISDLEGDELLESMRVANEKSERERSAFKAQLKMTAVKKEWAKAEKHLSTGVYIGNSERTQSRRNKEAREKDEQDAMLRKS